MNAEGEIGAVAVRQLAGKFVDGAGVSESIASTNGEGRKKKRRFART